MPRDPCTLRVPDVIPTNDGAASTIMNELTWYGETRYGTFNERLDEERRRLADAAKAADWPSVFDVLSRDATLVNTWRLEGSSLYTPLHQAAHTGAPASVVERLLELGAWRTLRNAKKERPVDVAVRTGHKNLEKLLEPRLVRSVLKESLMPLRAYLHGVIRARAERLVEEHALRLPEVEPLLEYRTPSMWFAVPGMHGGFRLHFEKGRGKQGPALLVESSCNVVEGSGECRRVTVFGVEVPSRRAR